MKFKIRFRIGSGFGTASIYTLRDFCMNVVDRYDLTETEIATIVTLQIDEEFLGANNILVKRIL